MPFVRSKPWGILLIAVFLANPLLMAQKDSPKKQKPSRAEILKTFRGEFVAITPGKGNFSKAFDMGSSKGKPAEQPKHRVAFDYEFSMAKHEVPQNLYKAVIGDNPSVWGGPRNSVEMVSFRDAQKFCAKATLLLREAELIEDQQVIRLPTEAEWEYCCRTGNTTAYSFGQKAQADDDRGVKASVLDQFGWHTGNAAGNDPPVGALKANAWGLHDMHGYLWEYVSDDWHPNYENAPANGASWEAKSPESSRELPRVIRGGSWRDPYPLLRSAVRWSVPDHVKSDAIGFRCVLGKQ